MKDIIENEIIKIREYEEIIEKALFDFAYKNPDKLKYNQLKNIENLIHYLISGEIDYIVRNPKEYLESLKY